MITATDPAELPEASCEHRHETLECVCLNCGKPGDAICPHCHTEYSPESAVEDSGIKPSSPQEMLAKFAALARMITAKRNSKFWWACFLVATGDAAADGLSMKDIGEQWNVGAACISKTCIEICGRLGIEPSRYMRDESARDSYRKSNIRKKKIT